ncbi:MAG: YegS/Rv2252/BmrU family lipid kinase [Oscillospiraceae bacterium]|nr:YegS/Rv2252/BmrU family lipid kinase [Oscillospiraceae bacterium]
MKHLFIINPIAGGSDKSVVLKERIDRIFEKRDDEYEIYVTSAPMDAPLKIISSAANGGGLRVYACGGDGTLNECVNGVAGLPGTAVTHYPCGTGNDFIKTFGAEKNKFTDLNGLINGRARPTDLINCNGRYCINICSVGLDARIGTDVHKYSKIPLIGGPGGYIISTVANVIKGTTVPLRISCGEEITDGAVTLVCACNGRYYGGFFNPMPTALIDDGITEFLTVGKVSRIGFIKMVGKYAKGRFRELGGIVKHLRGTRMEISSETELAINADGELLRGKEISFETVPGGVDFIFPEDFRYFDIPSGKN